MSLKLGIINLLSDGKFHSGEALGRELQVSRAAIWKVIKQLDELGIEIHTVKGKGYIIPNGLELLSKEKLQQQLSPSVVKKIHLEIISEINSTNQYLLDNKEACSGTVILAEYQKQGRGRRQRKWCSPFGTNIYFSLLWTFDKDPSELSGLSLAAGVAVANALERYGIRDVQLKWPNDVLWNYKKIAGILIEMTAETHSNTRIVLGIGLNINMPAIIEIDQAWTDVSKIIGSKPNRHLLSAYLIEEVIAMLTLFQEKGFSVLLKHWRALDVFYEKPVQLHTHSQVFSGIAKGINERGELILLDKNNIERTFLYGEVSLRDSKV